MQSAQTLIAQPMARAAFAPYGWLIDAAGHGGRAINAGSSERIDDLTELGFDAEGGAPCLAIFRARPRELAGPWQEMERHVLGTQTFIPMNGARYVVLVAGGGDRPDPTTLAAFLVGGHQGITLRAGTWHHGLLALDGGDFVVLERRAAQADCEIAVLPRPVRIALG